MKLLYFPWHSHALRQYDTYCRAIRPKTQPGTKAHRQKRASIVSDRGLVRGANSYATRRSYFSSGVAPDFSPPSGSLSSALLDKFLEASEVALHPRRRHTQHVAGVLDETFR